MVDWNSQFITLCGLKRWLLAFHHCPYVGWCPVLCSSACTSNGWFSRPVHQSHTYIAKPSSASSTLYDWFCPHTLGRDPKLPQNPTKKEIPSYTVWWNVRGILQGYVGEILESSNLTWQWKITISSEMDLQMLHPPQKITMDYNLKSKLLSQTTIILWEVMKKNEFPPLYSMQKIRWPPISPSSTNKTLGMRKLPSFHNNGRREGFGWEITSFS